MEKAYQKIYNTAIYVRLSDEDGDLSDTVKQVSNSISNQIALIEEFLSTKKDVKVVETFIDDGYTGMNYERPGFIKMMEYVHSKKIDCIVVKDLSRLGREYIDTGRYIEKIFPALGVRFIAINDNVDTLQKQDGILIPFKNLINDSYCRDASVKSRSSLEVKRKKGEYVGAFAPYGYEKDKQDKNKLVIDPYAASVVRDIFRWKIEGWNHKAIAERLNELEILPPSRYKRKVQGLRYEGSLKGNEEIQWCVSTVRAILENEIYTGVMVQGKRTTVNYKVKKVVYKDKSQWVRKENTHEAVILKKDFELVQKLLLLDTRSPSQQKKVYMFSGVAVCGDCGEVMHRKVSTVDGRKYVYYMCPTSRRKGPCTSHRITEKELTQTVLTVVQKQVELAVHMDECLKVIDKKKISGKNMEKLSEAIQTKTAEYEKILQLKASLYKDMKEGIVSKDDYIEIKGQFTRKKEQIEREIQALEEKRRDLLSGKDTRSDWLEDFLKYRNVKELTRTVIVELIDTIKIYEGKRIEIVFAHREEFSGLYEELTQEKKEEQNRLLQGVV